jgi:DNA-binding MarR family transcriptional regulator
LAEPLAREVDQRVLDALPKDKREQFLELLSVITSKLSSDPAA